MRVLPLDDINVVGADRAFGGFLSGTVTMTLTMYGLTQERASYLVLEAGGEKMSDTYFVDAQPPVIGVDLNGNNARGSAGSRTGVVHIRYSRQRVSII